MIAAYIVIANELTAKSYTFKLIDISFKVDNEGLLMNFSDTRDALWQQTVWSDQIWNNFVIEFSQNQKQQD